MWDFKALKPQITHTTHIMNKFGKEAIKFTAMLMIATVATNLVANNVPGAGRLLRKI